MDDVVFGFVHDFGANEEWTATRGGGAFLNGAPLTGRPKDEIEFLSIEATRAALVHEKLATLAPLTDRVRVMGAQAITFCHLAAGRTDAVVCLKAFARGRFRRLAAAHPRARACRSARSTGRTLGQHPARPRGRARASVAAGTHRAGGAARRRRWYALERWNRRETPCWRRSRT